VVLHRQATSGKGVGEMNSPRDFLSDIKACSALTVRELKTDTGVGRFVDGSLEVPQPFLGQGDVRLIILGQDPTVDNPKSRKGISTVLTLDRPGNLRTFVEKVCAGLGLSLDNVYATNVFKCFFTQRPTTVRDPDLLRLSFPYWLPILQRELAAFRGAAVVTFGEPLLKVLVQSECVQKVRGYLGYHPQWQQRKRNPFGWVQRDQSTIGRSFFPLPHQPSMRQRFYSERFDEYLAFVRQHVEQEAA
jgi:uracil-DNA glycosylase